MGKQNIHHRVRQQDYFGGSTGLMKEDTTGLNCV
jgi:hypothetical protein